MPVTLHCQRCGQPFRVKPSHVARSRYCSKACHYTDKRTIPETACIRCGAIFRPLTASSGLYCTQDCYNAARRELPAEQRNALMAKAQATVRGSKRSDEDMRRRAEGIQRRGKLSADEQVIYTALVAAGLTPVPLYAIDRFNIDFAFPDQRVAVEYNGGNWRNGARHRERDARKAALLAAHGWTLLVFPRIDKPQANDSGNARVTIEALVSAVAAAVHR